MCLWIIGQPYITLDKSYTLLSRQIFSLIDRYFRSSHIWRLKSTIGHNELLGPAHRVMIQCILIYYFLCEGEAFCNIIIQFVVTDIFLPIWTSPMTFIFPRMTKCRFETGGTFGSSQMAETPYLPKWLAVSSTQSCLSSLPGSECERSNYHARYTLRSPRPLS